MLLVLAVLAGVLAMHGLGPQPSSATPMGGGGHDMVMAQVEAVYPAGEDCSHPGGGSGSPHHADATCAAAGIGGAYTPPALAAALGSALCPEAVPGGVAVVTGLERAPPDLADLQLLRI